MTAQQSTTTPADRSIAAVLSDLDRFEQQNLSHPATAKRTLKMLPLSENRLHQSPNQDHLSWQVAKHRLEALRARLEGGDGSSTSASTVPSPTSTTHVVSSSQEVDLSVPPHNHQAAAQATMISQDRVRVQKLQRDLVSARQQMDARLNDAAYMQRLDAQEQRFVDQVASYQQSFAGDPDVEAASRALAEYEKAVASARAEATQLAASVGPCGKGPSMDPTTAAPQTMISQDVARVLKIQREIQSALQTLHQDGPRAFQLETHVAKQEYIAQTLQAKLEPYASKFPTDPNVMETTECLTKLQSTIRNYKAVATKELEQLGDVQAQLGVLERSIIPKPIVPSPPYTAETVASFCNLAFDMRRLAPQQLALLDRFEKRAYLPLGVVEYDSNRVKRMRWEIQDGLDRVERGLHEIQSNMDLHTKHVASDLEFFAKLDPANQHDQANVYLDEKGPGQYHKRLDEAEASTRAGLVFAEKQNDATKIALYTHLLERVAKAREKFDTDRDSALGLVRMPAAITPAHHSLEELEEIARDTLSNPKYDTDGMIVRLVVNADRRKLNREESEMEVNDVDVSLSGKVTMSGTKTTTRYEWEEFQVATAEEVGEKCFIFYSTLKYFTSGGHTTPLNKWILGGRFQSCEILPENIDKE